MKKGENGHKNANFSTIREKPRPTVKMFKTSACKNTLQLVMENQEKSTKHNSKTIGCIWYPAIVKMFKTKAYKKHITV